MNLFSLPDALRGGASNDSPAELIMAINNDHMIRAATQQRQEEMIFNLVQTMKTMIPAIPSFEITWTLNRDTAIF